MAAEIEDSLWTRKGSLSIPCGESLLATFELYEQGASRRNRLSSFDGELLAEGSRHEGFKCPHCRLFVPAERANGADGATS